MHNSKLTMDYFVSILYYFVFSYNQRVHKKKAPFFRTLFQSSAGKYRKNSDARPRCRKQDQTDQDCRKIFLVY